MFERKIYKEMKAWKEEQQGKTALLIKGARRVGKSTIAEEFAKREYRSYILIDFSLHNKRIDELFEDMSDLDYFFLNLQTLTHVDLYERESVIVFDEVQVQPLARQAIKHLVKDGRYDYIETGSLLSIKKNVKDIVIPSEETRITMHPMDLEEFRLALGDTVSTKLTRKAFEEKKPLSDVVNRRLMRDFRLYMLVGGMPQAVAAYIETNNFRKVDEVKRQILELYEDDFRKMDPTGRASLLFKAAPTELGKRMSRFQVSSVSPEYRVRDIMGVIANMEDSMTVNLCYRAESPSPGLSLSADISRFKMFLSDTGLFVTLAFMDTNFVENDIYEKLLSDKLPANLGYLYENITAQMLTASGYRLFYHTLKSETSNHSYEIDFLIPAHGGKVSPVEVKSSGYQTHKSLDVFSEKFSHSIAERYIFYTKDYRREGNVTLLPMYMVPFV